MGAPDRSVQVRILASNGQRRRIVWAAAVLGLCLGGCTSGIREIWHEVPAEQTAQPAYPPIGETPPARPMPVLTETERKQVEEDLKAAAASRPKEAERKIETGR